jgi:hypothetical protein
VQAAGVEGAGRARRDVRLDAVRARHRRPHAAQAFGIVPAFAQQRLVGHLAQAARQRRMQGVALVQRAHQAQHLGPVAGLLVGLHGPLQRVDVALAAGVQFGHGFQRAFRAVLVDQQFGHRHQARRLERLVVHGAGQPGVAPRRFAHAVRGAGADQGRQAGVLGQLGGAHRGLLGMAEAAFEQGFQGVAQAAVGFALALAQAVGGHPLGHAEGGAHRAQQPYSSRNSSAASTTNRFSDRSIRCGG